MRIEMLFTSTGEVWLLSVLLLIGALFILFSRGAEFVFGGMIMIAGVFTIAYTNHTHYLGERFLMEQFYEGRALSCGMWRGEGVRVDPAKDWRYEEGVGFVKGDVIINDPGVCSVIGKAFPEPSTVPYWMVFVSALAILLTLRTATLGALEKNDDTRAE